MTPWASKAYNLSMEIRPVTIIELEACHNIQDMLTEYAEESAIKGLPAPNAKVETYKGLESTGALHAIAAFNGVILAGFIVILSPVVPHYSAVVSVAESFFVSKEFRNTGAGLKLLRAAEDYAKSKGSPGLLVSAPLGGVLADVLPFIGYTETNRVFFRNLNE